MCFVLKISHIVHASAAVTYHVQPRNIFNPPCSTSIAVAVNWAEEKHYTLRCISQVAGGIQTPRIGLVTVVCVFASGSK